MTFEERYDAIGRLDRLSYGDTFIHRLDPRTKVVVTGLFLLTVVSFDKYAVTPLAPFFLFPVLLLTLGEIPAWFILRKVLFVSPFALVIGIFNPVLDTRTVGVIAGLPLAAGWLSFVSILLKFVLTVSAALLLVATTSFPGVCHALRRLGLPAPFVSQLLFLYRYLFTLLEEAMRIVRARDLRSFGGRGAGVRSFTRLIGVLFLRTVARAERIYCAMLARGFHGDIPTLRCCGTGAGDWAFLAAAFAYLAFFRLFPVTEGIGRLAEGWLG